MCVWAWPAGALHRQPHRRRQETARELPPPACRRRRQLGMVEEPSPTPHPPCAGPYHPSRFVLTPSQHLPPPPPARRHLVNTPRHLRLGPELALGEGGQQQGVDPRRRRSMAQHGALERAVPPRRGCCQRQARHHDAERGEPPARLNWAAGVAGRPGQLFPRGAGCARPPAALDDQGRHGSAIGGDCSLRGGLSSHVGEALAVGEPLCALRPAPAACTSLQGPSAVGHVQRRGFWPPVCLGGAAAAAAARSCPALPGRLPARPPTQRMLPGASADGLCRQCLAPPPAAGVMGCGAATCTDRVLSDRTLPGRPPVRPSFCAGQPGAAQRG